MRAVDYLSASLAVILGATSVADVLDINLRERASEFAVLSAVGWRRGTWLESPSVKVPGSASSDPR